MKKIERDPLRALDWRSVYGEVPDSVRAGAEEALARVRARARRRMRAWRALGAAACLLIVLGAGLFGLSGKRDAPDRVISPAAEIPPLKLSDVVYAGPEDPCFHLRADCPSAAGAQAALELVTALEFEKSACPLCCAEARLPEGLDSARADVDNPAQAHGAEGGD